ncbi:hypothetical protein KIF59_22640 [Enterobacter cloacae subsp. cloacae]|nr:hypothetical protein [Enterobacter cloacae subsp. cloacae]
MLIGDVLPRPVFRFIASVRRSEVFTAATLLLALGSAVGDARWGCRWRWACLSPGCCSLRARILPRTGNCDLNPF